MALLALNWATDNDSVLKHFKLLFYITLGEVTGKDKTLEEIITEQHEELNGMEEAIQTQLQDSDGQVLLILDGLDEYAMGTNTVIDNIVHNRSSIALCKTYIIITSRPEAENLHLIAKQIKKVIVAIGFDQQNVIQCAENFFKSAGNAEEASEFLKSGVSGLFRIPIVLLMAYLLYQEQTEQNLPTSKVEIIGEIIDLIIDRKKSRQLTKEEKKMIKGIVGEKAWMMVQNGTVVISQVCNVVLFIGT